MNKSDENGHITNFAAEALGKALIGGLIAAVADVAVQAGTKGISNVDLGRTGIAAAAGAYAGFSTSVMGRAAGAISRAGKAAINASNGFKAGAIAGVANASRDKKSGVDAMAEILGSMAGGILGSGTGAVVGGKVAGDVVGEVVSQGTQAASGAMVPESPKSDMSSVAAHRGNEISDRNKEIKEEAVGVESSPNNQDSGSNGFSGGGEGEK